MQGDIRGCKWVHRTGAGRCKGRQGDAGGCRTGIPLHLHAFPCIVHPASCIAGGASQQQQSQQQPNQQHPRQTIADYSRPRQTMADQSILISAVLPASLMPLLKKCSGQRIMYSFYRAFACSHIEWKTAGHQWGLILKKT